MSAGGRSAVGQGGVAVALATLATLAGLAGTAGCSASDSDPTTQPAPSEGGAPAPITCGAGEAVESGACVAAGIVACPSGMSGSEGVCTPTFPATCSAGTAKLLGETACAPIGHTTCPTGATVDPSGWGCAVTFAASCAGATRTAPGGVCVALGSCPSALPAGPVRHVDDDYGVGELDAAHFATLTDALAGVVAGTVIAVAAGTYHETVMVPAGVSIVGACTGDVILEPAPGATTPVVIAAAGSVTLRGLTLRGGPIGLQVKGATVSADSLVVERSGGIGVRVDAGSLSLKSSVVRDIVAGLAGDPVGVFALGGVTTVDDVTVDGSAGTGVSVWRGASMVARGLSVVHTGKTGSDDLGWGIDVESAGSFEGSRVFVSGASFAGLAASGKGSRIRLEDSVVGDVALGTFGPGGPSLGAGLALSEGSSAEIHRVSFGKTAGASMLVAVQSSLVADHVTARDGGDAGEGIGGLYVIASKAAVSSSVVVGAVRNGLQSYSGATVSVDGVLVRDTKPTSARSSGIGALVSGTSALDGKRLTLERNATAQLVALEGSVVKLDALATLEARLGTADNFGAAGIGLIGDDASKITLSNAYLGQSRFFGVSLRRGASFQATGFVVDGVELAAGEAGYGVLVIEGSSATLEDFAIRGTHGASLVVGEKDSKATLVRGTLRDPLADETPGVARGLSVQEGASVSLERVRILRSKATAMYITSSSRASLVACVVDGVTADGAGKFGDAFEVVDRAELRLDRTVVRNAQGAALVFAGGKGSVDASLVEHNAVGIHVQDGSELSESDAVPVDLDDGAVVVGRSTLFVENATKVGQGQLALPQPLPLE